MYETPAWALGLAVGEQRPDVVRPRFMGHGLAELLLQCGVNAFPVTWAKPCSDLENATVIQEEFHGTVGGKRAWRFPGKVYDFKDRERHGKG